MDEPGIYSRNTKPLVLALKILGVINPSDRKCKMKKSVSDNLYEVYRYLVLIFVNFEVIYAIYEATHEMTSESPWKDHGKLIYYLKILYKHFWTTTAAIIYDWLTWNRETISRIFHNLDEPNETKDSPFFTKKWFIFFVTFLTLALCIRIPLKPNSKIIPTSIASFPDFLRGVNSISTFIYVGVSLGLLSQYYIITCLFLALEFGSITKLLKSNKRPDTMFLRRISASYSRVCHATEDFDSCFSPYICLSTTCEMSYLCYEINLYVNYPRSFSPTGINYLLSIILVTFSVFLLICIAARVGSKSAEGVAYVTQLTNHVSVEDTVFHQQAILLVQHMSQNSKMARMTIGRMFPIHYQTIASAIAAIMTYCVLIVQFLDGRPSSKSNSTIPLD